MKQKGMTPKEIEAVLKDLGVCYRFRHEWAAWETLYDGSRVKKYFTDFRCTAPDTGNVISLEPGAGYPAENGDAVIYVSVREKVTREWPAGTAICASIFAL